MHCRLFALILYAICSGPGRCKYCMQNRLLPKQIKEHRQLLIEKQSGICPLCNQPIQPDDNVHLDHDHKSGYVRAALHGACNLGLGKVERAARMTRNPDQFVLNLYEYIIGHRLNPSGIFHPTHLTKDEKTERRKRKLQRRLKNNV